MSKGEKLAVWACFSDPGIGALAALNQVSRPGVPIYTWDFTKQTIDPIKKGEIAATLWVDADGMAEQMITMITDHLGRRQADRGRSRQQGDHRRQHRRVHQEPPGRRAVVRKAPGNTDRRLGTLMQSQHTPPALIVADGLSKSFGAVRALRDVSLRFESGKVHGLVGANGAGKSTFLHILGGVVQPDSGSVMVDGTAVSIGNPREAAELGFSFIHQELALIPE